MHFQLYFRKYHASTMSPASLSGTIGITGLSTPEKNMNRHYSNKAGFANIFEEKSYSHSMVLRIPRLLPSKAVFSRVLLKAHHSSRALSVAPFCTLTCHPNGLHSFPTPENFFWNATLNKLILFSAFSCAR